MDIGKAIKKVFDGKEFTYLEKGKTKTSQIKAHYGDQNELNKWIGVQNANKRGKYPLVFYVVGSNKKEYSKDGSLARTKARILILGLSEYNYINDTRNTDVYEKVINPVYKVIKNTLETKLHISLYSDFVVEDYPLMGITTDDFVKLRNDGKKLPVIDIVDAKSIEIDIELNLNCL